MAKISKIIKTKKKKLVICYLYAESDVIVVFRYISFAM